jgi:hypothetical protein
MAGFFLWFLLSICCFVAAAMLASYALWYYENQKVLDLTNQIKNNNQSNILNNGMGKRGFSSFDLNASINKSKTVAKGILAGAVSGANSFAKSVKNSTILGSVGQVTKKAAQGISTGLSGLIKPVREDESSQIEPEIPLLSPEEVKQQNYEADVDKLIKEDEPDTNDQATLNLASKNSSNKSEDTDELTVFEKLELRILNRLKESGMTNYDIWIELGALYKKFGQTEKAKEVFALVLKHAGDTNKERARNELIGLS